MNAGSIPPPASILVAVKQQPARAFLTDNLTADEYETIAASSVDQALWTSRPAASTRSWSTSGAETHGLLDQIRRQTQPEIDPQPPSLAIGGGDWLARTRLLERGADDVIAKPYSYPELGARLQALPRRAQARREPHVLRAGSLRLDTARDRRTSPASKSGSSRARSTSCCSRCSATPPAC